jgi:hypothetical protein
VIGRLQLQEDFALLDLALLVEGKQLQVDAVIVRHTFDDEPIE